MFLIFFSCTLLVVVATVLPILRHRHWTVRGLDFPRLQIAVLAAILLAAHLLFLDLNTSGAWGLIATTALCLFSQLWWILPYTFLWPKQVKRSRNSDASNQLKIITSNILKTNRNSSALLNLVAEYQPDILVTLESDRWWEKKLDSLEADMPYSVKCPLDNFYGMHVYSKLPIYDEVISYLVEESIPSIHLSLELRTGDRVQMHFLHPAPPSPTENPESKERDAELIAVARKISGSDKPIVVTGDLNDVAWSETTQQFLKISGLLDPRVGRGMFNTFHADYFFLRWPLDHLFHSHQFTLKHIKRLPPIGSDHFALFTALSYTPEQSSGRREPEANGEDLKRAKELSEKEGVSKDDVPQPNEP